jgi:predicted alpha/beta superfamily hydrolase
MPRSHHALGSLPALALGLALVARPAHAQSAHAASAPTPADPVPEHQTFTLESRAVGETRVINVYTPPGYASSTAAYPVLYMPDGGMKEDFPHVANTVDSLIALKAIAPVIVVGIENTQRRRDLTGPTTVAEDSAIAPRVGGSAAFRAFIRDELMPEVRRRWRTTGETAIIGESLAGLFIVETFLLEPTLFRRYVALDPSLWWNDSELLRTAAARPAPAGDAERTLFLSAGSEPTISAGTAKLAETLKARALPKLTLVYEPRPDLDHSTIYRGQGPAALAKVLD